MDDQNVQATSPLPQRKLESTTKFLDFYEALKAVVTGKKIFREEWENKEYYGFINKGNLSLHKPDGKTYQWIINDGDMNANDWIVL